MPIILVVTVIGSRILVAGILALLAVVVIRRNS